MHRVNGRDILPSLIIPDIDGVDDVVTLPQSLLKALCWPGVDKEVLSISLEGTAVICARCLTGQDEDNPSCCNSS